MRWNRHNRPILAKKYLRSKSPRFRGHPFIANIKIILLKNGMIWWYARICVIYANLLRVSSRYWTETNVTIASKPCHNVFFSRISNARAMDPEGHIVLFFSIYSNICLFLCFSQQIFLKIYQFWYLDFEISRLFVCK